MVGRPKSTNIRRKHTHILVQKRAKKRGFVFSEKKHDKTPTTLRLFALNILASDFRLLVQC